MTSATDGWRTTSLAQHVQHRSGNSKIIKGKQSSSPGAGLVPAFSASGQDVWVVSPEYFGDGVVVSAVGARCGKTFLASGQWTAIANTHVLIPGDELDARFLWYLTNDEHFWVKSGSAQPFVKAKDTLQRPLSLPPVKVQRRIVDILEDHFSRLDAAARGLRSVTARIRGLTAVVLTAETQTFEAASLASLATQSGYGTSTKCVVAGPGPAVARIPNLVDGRIEMLDEKRVADPDVDVSNFMLNEGDLLIVRTNGSRELIGRSAVVQAGIEAAFASYLIRFRVDAKRVLPAWVNAVLGNPSTRERLEGLAASSAGQYNLSLGKLGPVPIPLPALAEQERILAKIQDHVTATSRLQGEVCRAVGRSAQLRRGLLQAAFAGQLTGSSSDLERAEEAVA